VHAAEVDAGGLVDEADHARAARAVARAVARLAHARQVARLVVVEDGLGLVEETVVERADARHDLVEVVERVLDRGAVEAHHAARTTRPPRTTAARTPRTAAPGPAAARPAAAAAASPEVADHPAEVLEVLVDVALAQGAVVAE